MVSRPLCLVQACTFTTAQKLLLTCSSFGSCRPLPRSSSLLRLLCCFAALGVASPLLGLASCFFFSLAVFFRLRCPKPDPGVSFQLFVDGAMCIFGLLVTFLMWVVIKVCFLVEQEVVASLLLVIKGVVSAAGIDVKEFSEVHQENEGKGAAACLRKASASARVDVLAPQVSFVSQCHSKSFFEKPGRKDESSRMCICVRVSLMGRFVLVTRFDVVAD